MISPIDGELTLVYTGWRLCTERCYQASYPRDAFESELEAALLRSRPSLAVTRKSLLSLRGPCQHRITPLKHKYLSHLGQRKQLRVPTSSRQEKYDRRLVRYDSSFLVAS